MVWRLFRRLFGGEASRAAKPAQPAQPAPQPAPAAALPARSEFAPVDDGAHESLRARIMDFEGALQSMSQLPEQFRLLLPTIETSLSATTLLRSKMETFEEALSQEQNKLSSANLELSMVKGDLERVEFALKREELSHARQRERSVEFESALAALRRENAEIQAKVTRLEPLHREAAMQKDTLEIELQKLAAEKKRIEELSLDNARELQLLRDQIAKEGDLVASLRQTNLKATERIEEAQNEIFDRDNSIASLNEKLAAAVSTLTRERGVLRGLRADNEQLLKERDDNKAQFESQLEAARGRFRLVERLLEESRARFQAETQQLSVTKREKGQREYDITQLSTALDAAKVELADLRAQSMAGSETLASVNAQLATESEKRRRLEMELDMLREENGKLAAMQKSISTVSLNEQLALEETSKELQARISALRSENTQLRSELNLLRYSDPVTASMANATDADPVSGEGGSKVVPINR